MRLTTRAHLDPCPRCRAATIHALDAPVAGRAVRLDPVPLTALEELVQLLAGQITYDLIPVAHHHEVSARDKFRIAGERKHSVLALHQCPGRIPATAIPRMQPRKDADLEPPF